MTETSAFHNLQFALAERVRKLGRSIQQKACWPQLSTWWVWIIQRRSHQGSRTCKRTGNPTDTVVSTKVTMHTSWFSLHWRITRTNTWCIQGTKPHASPKNELWKFPNHEHHVGFPGPRSSQVVNESSPNEASTRAHLEERFAGKSRSAPQMPQTLTLRSVRGHGAHTFQTWTESFTPHTSRQRATWRDPHRVGASVSLRFMIWALKHHSSGSV